MTLMDIGEATFLNAFHAKSCDETDRDALKPIRIIGPRISNCEDGFQNNMINVPWWKSGGIPRKMIDCSQSDFAVEERESQL